MKETEECRINGGKKAECQIGYDLCISEIENPSYAQPNPDDSDPQ